jgi:hypothetical protein
VSEACRQFPNETCLFGETRPDSGCCEVCKSVAAWSKSKMEYVMVREIHAGQGLYVFPVSAEPSQEDRRQCLLELRIADTPLRDIRQAVNTYLLAAEESWIHARNQCVRVR